MDAGGEGGLGSGCDGRGGDAGNGGRASGDSDDDGGGERNGEVGGKGSGGGSVAEDAVAVAVFSRVVPSSLPCEHVPNAPAGMSSFSCVVVRVSRVCSSYIVGETNTHTRRDCSLTLSAVVSVSRGCALIRCAGLSSGGFSVPPISW